MDFKLAFDSGFYEAICPLADGCWVPGQVRLDLRGGHVGDALASRGQPGKWLQCSGNGVQVLFPPGSEHGDNHRNKEDYELGLLVELPQPGEPCVVVVAEHDADHADDQGQVLKQRNDGLPGSPQLCLGSACNGLGQPGKANDLRGAEQILGLPVSQGSSPSME